MDRAKSLDLAISQLEKTFGKGTVMRLGSREKLAVDTVPTGSLALDLVLGVGGLPKGRIIEIYGQESSGKTTLAYHVVAEAFAAGARRTLGTDYGLAVTGLPGPGGGTADKPVGLVFIAFASREEVTSRRYQFPGRPDEVRQRAVLAALDGLRRVLQA